MQAAWKATSKIRLRRLQTPSDVDETNEASTSKATKRRSKRVLSKKKAPEDKVAAYLKMYIQLRQGLGWELVSVIQE